MSKITTIIFDVGGVLLRTEDKRPRTMLADAFGMSVRELEDLVFGGESGDAAQRGEISAAAQWEHIRQKLNLQPDEVGPVRDTFFSGDILDRDLLEAIRPLRTGYRLAILSNALDDARQSLTQRFGLGEIFDPIVISAEEGVMKPDARIFEIALARCGAEAAEAVFVDDFPHNIRGAQAVGMQTVWFRSREQALADLGAILEKV